MSVAGARQTRVVRARRVFQPAGHRCYPPRSLSRTPLAPGRRLDGLVDIGVGARGGDRSDCKDSATQELLEEERTERLRWLAVVVLGHKIRQEGDP